MVTVMIVDDDRMVRLLTKARLGTKYRVLEAADGAEALEIMSHEHVDLVILDIQMPVMDGYEMLKSIRAGGDLRPVIMLTAMGTMQHKREGFESGADDYMVKPIDYDELIWRIDALLRRSRIATEKRMEIGGLVLDEDKVAALYEGKNLGLTRTEFDLLYKLLSYPDVVFTKQQLMDDVWGYDTETDYDTIKTYISRLRGKLDGCTEVELVSIRGLGYKAVIHESGAGREGGKA
ncbi:MAG: response regulator transcription factor [Clostridia bacterium]|nr:response regulator transcription factor [Clostridia bacterium]